MSLAADKKRWDELHAAYAKASEAAHEYDLQLARKYGSTYQPSWLKKGDRDKQDALRARADKIGDKIVELLVRVSPRGQAWLSGVPAHWIRSDLTWEDAIRPRDESLSVVPPTAWGSTTPIQEVPMSFKSAKAKNIRNWSDAKKAGDKYGSEQVNSTYFMDWVREQLAEASRMDPSTVLPLETKADAKVIAHNMLQQLEWDTKRDLAPREIASLIGVDVTEREDIKEFFEGFRNALDSAYWLPEELLEIKRDRKSVV